jgi:type IV conjugative transfer system lipoprotein TraV
MIKKIIKIIPIMSLVACSSNVKSTWNCPLQEGGKGNCISIKEADLSGNSGSSTSPKSNFSYLNSDQKIEINLVAPKLKDLKKLQEENKASILPESSEQSKLRSHERVGKVWFAPYIDGEGNQHSEYVVFVIDEEAKWIIQK